MYFQPAAERDDVIGLLPLANVGLAVTDFSRDASARDRERGGARLRARPRPPRRAGDRGWSAGERLAFALGPDRGAAAASRAGPPAERRALVAVIRAKGGRRESEFVRRFDAHPKLRAAMRGSRARTTRTS